ncbi:MAG: GtrA family protein [Puniceicoccales bacterium]|nr:GtrA family protein [Puniceicoccales bacterium]
MFRSLFEKLFQKNPTEFFRFARFCIIGGVNTVIHFLVLNACVLGTKTLAAARPFKAEWLDNLADALSADWLVLTYLPIGLFVWANSVAFLVANTFSYFVNSRWSFDATLKVGRYARFLPTSCVGLSCAYGIMHFVTLHGWHYNTAVLIQVCVTPFINFALLRLFVFPKKKPDTCDASPH